MNELLRIENVKKSFGDHQVHNGIGLEVYQGEILGILGPSGTGKSVLLRSIIGLEHIDSGKILFEGREIQDFSEDEFLKIRPSLSYSFQNGALFDSLNVYENLAYPLREHTQLSESEISKKIHYVLDLVDLDDKHQLMPADLSGGMQKRVGMARSMILDPKLVLFDEPTAGLDPENGLKIVQVLKKLKSEGVTGILVTHDIPAAIEICDRMVILSAGKVVFTGTTEKFLSSDDPFIAQFKMFL